MEMSPGDWCASSATPPHPTSEAILDYLLAGKKKSQNKNFDDPISNI
jgi:hypothetical protein